MSGKLYIGNSTSVELQGLTNVVTDLIDTGATVSVTVKDSNDTNVTGESWPVTLTHVAGGTYRATLSSSISLTEGDTYKIVVTAQGSGSETGQWTETVTATVRGADE